MSAVAPMPEPDYVELFGRAIANPHGLHQDRDGGFVSGEQHYVGVVRESDGSTWFTLDDSNITVAAARELGAALLEAADVMEAQP